MKQRRAETPEHHRNVRLAWELRNPEFAEQRNAAHSSWYWRKGRTPERRERGREERLRKEFGLTVAEYDEMFKTQAGLCALCDKPETQRHHLTAEIVRLAVDHDHSTGEIRGLLCRVCNQLVGRVEKVGLERFADYLGGKRGRG